MAELRRAGISRPRTVKSFLCLHIPSVYSFGLWAKPALVIKASSYSSFHPRLHAFLSVFIPSSLLRLCNQGRPLLIIKGIGF